MGCGSSNAANGTPVQQNANVVIPTNGGARPLTVPGPYVNGGRLTMSELTKQRQEFWDSRVDGNTIIWQSLRRVSEALLVDDLSLANVLLAASNISTPYGNLDVCYDELGYEYKIPHFCYATPTDVVQDHKDLPQPPVDGKPTIPKKNIQPVQLTLKIRVNPGDHNFTITIDTSSSIYDLKTSIFEQTKLGENVTTCPIDRQRIMFLGRELKNNYMYLDDAGLDETKVVQVFLRPEPATPPCQS